jgi:hypothetical protein
MSCWPGGSHRVTADRGTRWARKNIWSCISPVSAPSRSRIPLVGCDQIRPLLVPIVLRAVQEHVFFQSPIEWNLSRPDKIFQISVDFYFKAAGTRSAHTGDKCRVLGLQRWGAGRWGRRRRCSRQASAGERIGNGRRGADASTGSQRTAARRRSDWGNTMGVVGGVIVRACSFLFFRWL